MPSCGWSFVGYGRGVARYSHLALLCAAMVGGCAAVLGADFDRSLAQGMDGALADDGSIRPEGSLPERPDAGDATMDAETAAPPAPAECGDMRGFQVGAPWPTEGYCNTRVGRSGAPSLSNPKIAWRYTLPGPTASFLSSGVIAADGTTYLIGFDPPDASGLAYSLVAISKTGTEIFRSPLTGSFGSTASPTIGADGTIYVCAQGNLSAWTPTGAMKWSRSLGEGLPADSAPTILADGTVVVVGVGKLLAFRPDGSARWDYPADGYGFVGTVAVTTSGLLVVGEMPPIGQLNGALHILSPEGVRRFKMTVDGTPTTTPVVVGGTKVAVATTLQRYYVFTETGSVDTTKAGPSLNLPHPMVVYSAPNAWFAGKRSSPVTLDLVSGAMTTHGGLGNVTTALAAARDGTLIMGARQGIGRSVLIGISADGSSQRWSLDLEYSPDDPESPVLAADGTVLLAWGKTLYAIRD